MYDLHSLRVTLITALANEGGVPIPILSRCIAGHSSILMTLYYVKFNAVQISETLSHAQERIGLQERRNFLTFLQSAEYKSIAKMAVSNHESGLLAINENAPGTWVISDKGICPVGGALCDKGGKKLTSNPQLSDYSPTPGGPRNCVRCRFFITGPAFLGGLVAHFNAAGVRLLAASERFRAGEAAIRQLEDAIAQADERNPRSSLMSKLQAAHDRHQRGMQEVDDVAHNLHAIYRLTERCRRILADSKTQRSGKLSLVLVGSQADLEAAIEMTTDFELMNSVCQAALVYPGEDSTMANLRRARILDAMLIRSGSQPVFATLSEEEALIVGNEFVNLLIKRFGHSDAVGLLTGQHMMNAAGIADDIKNVLKLPRAQPLNLTLNYETPSNQLPAPTNPQDATK